MQEKNRAYYLAHRERILALAAKYRSENRDKIRAWFREYDHTPVRMEKRRQNFKKHAAKRYLMVRAKYHANRDAICERRKSLYRKNRENIINAVKAYYWRNKKRVLEKSRERYALHKGRLIAAAHAWRKKRRADDPEYRRAQDLKHEVKRRLRAGAVDDGTITYAVRKRLLHDAVLCCYCSEKLTNKTKTLDHKEPLSRGGLHGVSNIAVCCASCNSKKNNKPYSVWLAGLQVSCAM